MITPELEKLAKEHGIDLAKAAGRRFAEWLLTRPFLARRPALARLIYFFTFGHRK